ncbi:hypothetical protein PRIPAC_92131 [Pristionchus pacificus]|uniref:Uncharacterized protein n=1 Tax=Pristionchus pacificus TaxID=54126 RepID=A0A2A6BNZ3_PRIPA|nr:hypothetical protein PRIPAC_92131 [Pristionchus pacificus]|eukprot:PDM67627.1 hypothetical protein PRIPAC_45671 [Pristionchus pacificus]
MEEDNAGDIFKSLSGGKVDVETEAFVKLCDRSFNARLRVRGNILCVQAISEAVEPLIFILVKHQVLKAEDNHPDFPHGFVIQFKNETLTVYLKDKEERERWMVKVATASHDMAQAELDEIAHRLFAASTAENGVDHKEEKTAEGKPGSSSFEDFFLTNPCTIQHKFSITQKAGVPARLITYSETIAESKLSIALPVEFVKLYKQWTTEMIQQIESFERRCPAQDESSRQELCRLLRENSETLEQTWEFLSTYSGPSFRKSIEKRRVAFAPVPTNLHYQRFGPIGGEERHVLTAGVAAALPLRFQSGGLPKLRSSLSLHPAYTDAIFSAKRSELFEIKKMIGALSYKLENEWPNDKECDRLDKLCVDLQAGVKQVYARLRDVETGLAGVERHVDSLMDIGHAPDTLRNQLDNMDAMLVSLQTKIAVIDSLMESPSELSSFSLNTRESMIGVLDALLSLCTSLIDAQQLGRLRSLARSADTAVYVHIILRADFVFSQASTIAATAVMSRLQRGWPMNGGAWRSISSRLLIRLVRCPSSVSRTVTPLVAGSRHCVIVSLPLPQDFFDALPPALRDPAHYIRVCTSFWSLGVNHEATIGYQFGGVAAETAINQTALSDLQSYASSRSPLSAAAQEALAELQVVVRADPSRKNMLLYEWAMAAGTELDGELVVSCKSGKDRTAMGVTLEQGRLMRQASGLNATQAAEVVDALRKNGARREVCRKNIDKAAYSFSAFQMHFLPKSFRPPSGTFAHGLST